MYTDIQEPMLNAAQEQVRTGCECCPLMLKQKSVVLAGWKQGNVFSGRDLMPLTRWYSHSTSGRCPKHQLSCQVVFPPCVLLAWAIFLSAATSDVDRRKETAWLGDNMIKVCLNVALQYRENAFQCCCFWCLPHPTLRVISGHALRGRNASEMLAGPFFFPCCHCISEEKGTFQKPLEQCVSNGGLGVSCGIRSSLCWILRVFFSPFWTSQRKMDSVLSWFCLFVFWPP